MTYWFAFSLLGYDKIVPLLLEKGANINTTNNKQETALHSAAMEGHEKIVSILIEKGAEVDAKNIELETPLHVAAKNGNPG